MKGECRNSWRAEETVVSGETEREERREAGECRESAPRSNKRLEEKKKQGWV